MADQYSSKVVSGSEKHVADAVDFCERAKFVPMRLTYDERKYLRLIDATMHVAPRWFLGVLRDLELNLNACDFFEMIWFCESMS